MNKEDPLLSVRGLKKYFPIRQGFLRRTVAEVKAVDGLDFDLFPGEVLGVVGESGCGKSTVARSVIRLIEPSSGAISYRGTDLLAYSRKQLLAVRPQMQMVFQDPLGSLNPRKRVIEAIGDGLIYHGIAKSSEQARACSAEALQTVGLSPDILERYPHQFSGGQQQRICIARAIALKPRLLICDEAVSALDVSVQAQILNLLSELKQSLNLSYLFISHDMSVIRYLCDRVIVLYLGKVMEIAPTEELFRNPKHPYTQALLSAIPRRHPRESVERLQLSGEIPSPSNPPSGCPFRTRCPYAEEICKFPPPKKTLGTHSYWCIRP